MANFPPLAGYPFGLKAQLSHNDVNTLSEQGEKTVNATDGSSHAPTGDLEWSGANGGGFKFSTTNPFIFKGKLDVTSGLTVTSPSSGTWTFDDPVNVLLNGNMAIGVSSVVLWGTGSTTTGAIDWQAKVTASGATAAEWAFSTSNPVPFHGKLNVTSGLTFATGGSVTVASGVAFVLVGNMAVDSGSVIAFGNGATLTGGTIDSQVTITQSGNMTISGDVTHPGDLTLTGATTFASSTKPLLDPARSWTRRATRIAAVEGDLSVDPICKTLFSQFFTDTPIFTFIDGAASALRCMFEFDPPPDGATAATVTIQSRGTDPGGTVDTLATYHVVRWQEGTLAVPESMATVTGDAHTGGQANFQTKVTTTISLASHLTIDLAWRYGVLATAPLSSGVSVNMSLDIKMTGTVAAIAGT